MDFSRGNRNVGVAILAVIVFGVLLWIVTHGVPSFDASRLNAPISTLSIGELVFIIFVIVVLVG